MDGARIVTVVRGVAWYLAAALAVAVVLLPLAVERAVERVSVEERIGTIPVEVSLARNGRCSETSEQVDERPVRGDAHLRARLRDGRGILPRPVALRLRAGRAGEGRRKPQGGSRQPDRRPQRGRASASHVRSAAEPVALAW